VSTIKVDAIQKLNGSVPKASDLGLNVTGSVLQVVQGSLITGIAFSDTSYRATGLNLTITPSSASSKILLNTSFGSGYPTSNHGITYTFYRGSTNLDLSSPRTGFANLGHSGIGSTATYFMRQISLTLLDSPSSTSELTYAVYCKVSGGTGYWNMNENGDANSRQTAIITAMEIGG
jgi:hypothetical protein